MLLLNIVLLCGVFCAVFVWLVVCMLPLGLSCHCIGNLNVDYRTDFHLDDKEDSFRLE